MMSSSPASATGALVAKVPVVAVVVAARVVAGAVEGAVVAGAPAGPGLRNSQRPRRSIPAGSLKVRLGGVYPLAEAARAHADMESRRTTGKLLLVP